MLQQQGASSAPFIVEEHLPLGVVAYGGELPRRLVGSPEPGDAPRGHVRVAPWVGRVSREDAGPLVRTVFGRTALHTLVLDAVVENARLPGRTVGVDGACSANPLNA